MFELTIVKDFANLGNYWVHLSLNGCSFEFNPSQGPKKQSQVLNMSRAGLINQTDSCHDVSYTFTDYLNEVSVISTAKVNQFYFSTVIQPKYFR